MARRGGFGGRRQQQQQHAVEMEEETVQVENLPKVEDNVSSNGSAEMMGSEDEGDRTESNSGSTATTGSNTSTSNNSTDTSSASSIDTEGIRPTQAELEQESRTVRQEILRTKLALAEEQLALSEKRLEQIETGDDEEWNERLEEARKGQDKKLGIARERFRLANEAIRTEFQASVEQIQEELREAKMEILLAQEAKYRIKAEHHSVPMLGARSHAGHELPLHVEVQLPPSEVSKDVERINAKLSSASGEKDSASSSRKHSLAEGQEGHGDAEDEGGPVDADGNPYRLAKVRRKSR